MVGLTASPQKNLLPILFGLVLGAAERIVGLGAGDWRFWVVGVVGAAGFAAGVQHARLNT